VAFLFQSARYDEFYSGGGDDYSCGRVHIEKAFALIHRKPFSMFLEEGFFI